MEKEKGRRQLPFGKKRKEMVMLRLILFRFNRIDIAATVAAVWLLFRWDEERSRNRKGKKT